MLLVLLALAPGPPPTSPLLNLRRVFSSHGLHVGVAPALSLSPFENAGGITVQLTL
jgi:hypothetical protein